MAWFFIPLGIIAISLTVIGIIVGRKVPRTKSLRAELMRQEKQAKVKLGIIEKRIARQVKTVGSKAGKVLAPVWDKTKKASSGAYSKALELEEQYKKEIQQERVEERSKTLEGKSEEKEQLVKNAIKECRAHLKKDELEKAEHKCIEAISLDPKSVEGYELLGDIYQKQDMIPDAEEVFSHLLKLVPAGHHIHAKLGDIRASQGRWIDAAASYELACEIAGDNAGYFFALGECRMKQGQHSKALEALEKAVEFEPANPKYLDFLIEEAITCGNKLAAQNGFSALKKVNPENGKLSEFKQRIGQMGRRWDKKKM